MSGARWTPLLLVLLLAGCQVAIMDEPTPFIDPPGYVCVTVTPTMTLTPTNTPIPTPTSTKTPTPTATPNRELLPPGVTVVLSGGAGWIDLSEVNGYLPEDHVPVQLVAADGVILAEGELIVRQRR